jgi:protein-disulfide isomerase
MTKQTLAALMATTFIGFISSTAASTSKPVFTTEQEARIGEIAADYLVTHPEILVQVSQKLQAQQKAKQQAEFAANVMENQQALLSDADTPVVGPEGAKVAVIEFFDYQCVYCSHLAPELEKVMKSSPNVRYIFKEWPIFASRWENSQKAAETGLKIWKSGDADAYIRYHNGIYATGHFEGALTSDDIAKASAGNKLDAGDKTDIQAILDKNNELAQALGLTGTPGLIVMPVSQATPNKITVLPGAAPAEQILDAIKKASD